MKHWLVGLVDGDGTFAIDRQTRPNGSTIWNLVFKISLKQYNTRAIMKAKKFLGAGRITKTQKDNMIRLRIRDCKQLRQIIFPLFDSVSLLSTKYYDYLKVRQIADILDQANLSLQQRDEKITTLLQQHISRDQPSPVWSRVLTQQEYQDYQKTGDIDFTRPQVEQIICLPWLLGFVKLKAAFISR